MRFDRRKLSPIVVVIVAACSGQAVRALLGLATVGMILSGGQAARADWAQQAKLIAPAPDGEPLDWFGLSVAVDGDRAVAGASEALMPLAAGSAYIYERTGATWTQTAKLTSSDAVAGDRFGYAVDVSGDRSILGAHGSDDAGSDSGAAYIFERVAGVWTQAARLTASDGGAGDGFGYMLGISGDTAVVAAHGDDEVTGNAGAAYIFERIGGVWTETAKLTASDGGSGDWLGYSVSISGDVAVAGSVLNDGVAGDAGAAYVYERPIGGWTDMTETVKLTAGDGASGDQFGFAVAVEGDTIVVGAHWDDNIRGSGAGAAYIFERNGSSWAETAKLIASDGDDGDDLGSSVAVDGDVVVAGARFDEPAGAKSGSAYVFAKLAGAWTELDKLTADDAAAGDELGWCVDVSGGTVIAGAHLDDPYGAASGAAYIFTPEPGALVLLGLGAAAVLRRRRRGVSK